ncbi:MAG: thiamine diphosphokinase [Anaerolineales bacterium]|nr:thiamine diphosphokinase [Anaerolineales bacterium]
MVLIFANGDVADVGWIRPYLPQAAAIIAADGGARHLRALGRLPDVIVGDMDSVAPEELARLAAAGVQVQRVPAAKDETDLELALLYAVAHFPGEVLLFGALGGRIDQTLGNIFLLAHPRLQGRRVQLLDAQQRVWLASAADGEVRVNGRVGDLLSLLPCGGDAVVAQTSGLRWPLRQERLLFGPARGISNELTAAEATLSIASGRLICVHTRGAWGR